MTAVASHPGTREALSQVEIAGGVPLGRVRAEPFPDVPRGLTPVAAFGESIRAALQRPPCVLGFSGGRDSSAILAVAARLARDEGLEPPVVVSLRFRNAPGATEVEWQERVVAHAGVDEWLRIDVDEELDYVGPIAQGLLLETGLIYPSARALFSLQLRYARGGALLTGYGGDAVVGGWLPSNAAEVRAGLARPAGGAVAAVGYVLAPPFVRRAAMRTRLTCPPWLRGPARREFMASRSAELASRPARFDRFLAWQLTLRRVLAFETSLNTLAADAGASAVHPFHDRRFLAAFARAGGARGFGDRTSTMRALFSRDLPSEVIARPTKANFSLVYFRGHTRAFARRWDGGGFDPELVDAEALRRTWLDYVTDARSALALQRAWLDSVQRGIEEPLADLG